MAKSRNTAGSPGTEHPTGAEKHELPEDRETLRQMLDGLSDCIDRARPEFVDNPLATCEGLAGLLDGIWGTRGEGVPSVATIVKPGFRVAAECVDRAVGLERLLALREAVAAYLRSRSEAEDRARSHFQSPSDNDRRAPIFLDEDREKAFWDQRRDEGVADSAFGRMRVCFARLLDILVSLCNEVAEKLAAEQSSLPDRAQEEHEEYASEPPPAGSNFAHGPVRGTLKDIATWMDMD